MIDSKIHQEAQDWRDYLLTLAQGLTNPFHLLEQRDLCPYPFKEIEPWLTNHLVLARCKRPSWWTGTVQGNGQPQNKQFPFKDPTLDIAITPRSNKTHLLRLLNETVKGDFPATLAIAGVIYRCDIWQYLPHGVRGKTLIPYELAYAQAGYELRSSWPHLPEEVHITEIPLEFQDEID